MVSALCFFFSERSLRAATRRLIGGGGGGGEAGFPRLDYVLQLVEEVGIKVVLVLVNNWDDVGGMDVYVEQLAGANK